MLLVYRLYIYILVVCLGYLHRNQLEPEKWTSWLLQLQSSSCILCRWRCLWSGYLSAEQVPIVLDQISTLHSTSWHGMATAMLLGSCSRKELQWMPETEHSRRCWKSAWRTVTATLLCSWSRAQILLGGPALCVPFVSVHTLQASVPKWFIVYRVRQLFQGSGTTPSRLSLHTLIEQPAMKVYNYTDTIPCSFVACLI